MIDRNTTEDTGIAAYADSNISGSNDAYLFLVFRNDCLQFLFKNHANVASRLFVNLLDIIDSALESSGYTSEFLKTMVRFADNMENKRNDFEYSRYFKSVDGLWCPALPSSYGHPTMVVDIKPIRLDNRGISTFSWTIDLAAYGRREQFTTEKRSLGKYEFSDKIHKFFEHEGGVCECEGKSAADLILG